ncbi:MAG TPA: hypothetical protein VHT03_01305 [Rhizomicrobium sp.]|jgi:hypothetical protein|nr:hypothetical protein [Rhizomicrobium sp.]
MGQNNDPTEHGDLQGNQGGNLSQDPKEHIRRRQPEEGFARAGDVERTQLIRRPDPPTRLPSAVMREELPR